MTDLERAVRAVEHGLIPAIHIQGHPGQRFRLDARMARYHVPGFSIALVEGGEIAWAKGYGVQQAGDDRPVTSETRFQAASISKPVSAMAALHLVEDGILDLDADVNETLHSWRVPENEHTQGHKVTLRGLLSHTAGLTVSGYLGYAAGEDVPTVQQILDGAPPANSEPVRVMQEPGTAYSYSGGGYTVMQQLLEDVTGKPFATLLQELVLDPLRMAHSTFEQPPSEAYAAHAATAHRGDGVPMTGKWHTYPERATAGLWTTPSDLARFAIEVLKSHSGASNAVLSTDMTRQMLTPPLGWYGLGLLVTESEGWTRIEHHGNNEGYRCLMVGFLSAGQGVVWMTNGDNGDLVGDEVMRALAQVYGWLNPPQVERRIARIDRTVYARYEGQYRHAEYGDYGARIVREGNRLVMVGIPDGVRYVLYPASERAFFCHEMRDDIAFVEGPNGDVEAMAIGAYWRLERMN